jgi:hypothetical protein
VSTKWQENRAAHFDQQALQKKNTNLLFVPFGFNPSISPHCPHSVPEIISELLN